MPTLDQLLAQVTAERTVIDGITTFVNGLKDQLRDALAGADLSPVVAAKVDAIYTKAVQNAQALSLALAANVPPPAP